MRSALSNRPSPECLADRIGTQPMSDTEGSAVTAVSNYSKPGQKRLTKRNRKGGSVGSESDVVSIITFLVIGLLLKKCFVVRD